MIDAPPAARPRVGVVVPAHQAEHFLGEALRSLQEQTFGAWTCVVVDDGSSDGTADVAEAFLADPRFHLVRQVRGGVAAARNAGLRHLAGRSAGRPDLVAFLDADDVLLPDAYERLVDVVDASPRAVGAYGTAEYVDEAGRPFSPGLHPRRQRDRRVLRGLDLAGVPVHETMTTFAMLAVVGPVWPSAVVMLRLDVVQRVGGFDADLPQVEDWDLYLRATRHGPLAFVDRQVAWYRRHAHNLTNATTENTQLAHVVRCRTWASRENTPGQRLTAHRVWRVFQHRRLLHALRRCVAAVRAGAWTRLRQDVAVLAVEAVQLLRVLPPTGPTGSPLGAPRGFDVHVVQDARAEGVG